MQNRFAAALGIGIALAGILVAAVLFMQRGARVGITGSVLKVRTAPLDENSSIAVIDFRFANPANVNFVVEKIAHALTKDQRTTWREMTGDEFKFTTGFGGGGFGKKKDANKDK